MPHLHLQSSTYRKISSLSLLALTRCPSHRFIFHTGVLMEMSACCGTTLISLNVGQIHGYPAMHEIQGTRFKKTRCYCPQQERRLAASFIIPPRCSHDVYQSGQDKSLDNVGKNLSKMLEKICCAMAGAETMCKWEFRFSHCCTVLIGHSVLFRSIQ